MTGSSRPGTVSQRTNSGTPPNAPAQYESALYCLERDRLEVWVEVERRHATLPGWWEPVAAFPMTLEPPVPGIALGLGVVLLYHPFHHRFVGGVGRAAHPSYKALLRSLARWGRDTRYWLDFELMLFRLTLPFAIIENSRVQILAPNDLELRVQLHHRAVTRAIEAGQ